MVFHECHIHLACSALSMLQLQSLHSIHELTGISIDAVMSGPTSLAGDHLLVGFEPTDSWSVLL